MSFKHVLCSINYISLLFCIPFAFAECPPDCKPAPEPSDDGTGEVVADDLFETDPQAAVEETTGLTASDDVAAGPREDGGAHIDSASSLEMSAGRTFTEVRNADVSTDGNMDRAEEAAVDGNRFSDAENLEPVGSEPGNVRADRAASISGRDFEAEQAEEIEIAGNGDLHFGTVKKAVIGDIVAYNAIGISRRNGILSIGRADRIEITDGLLGSVEKFSGSGVSFHVDRARDVVIDCVSLSGVEHSDLDVSADSVRVKPDSDGVDFTVSDCRFSQSSFQAFSDKSEITIPRNNNRDYQINDGDLTCHGPKMTDRIEAQIHSTVRYGDHCFSCLSLGPGSTYWYADEDLTKDFGLTTPGDGKPYTLCLRKKPEDRFANVTGLVDFVDHRMELSGKITYLRVPVKNSKIINLITDPVYESLDDSNQAVFELDDDFNMVSRLSLSNSNPAIGVLAFIMGGHYAVYERNDGTETKRFGRFNDRFKAAVIEEYVSGFGSPSPAVSFADDLLVQEGLNDFGTMTRVTAVCDDCSWKAEIEHEITGKKKQLSLAADRCGI